jgi:hypothetical protein
MGLFFRKSIKFGPFRVNLSKSGIGFSGGVKGARISTGPRGTELHLGRKGIYYRKKLGGLPPPRPSSAQPYPQTNLQNCTRLNYQSNYTDVVKTLGLPDDWTTTFPPDAKIPNTILYYAGKGAVLLIYENGNSLGNTHYLGTKAFHPERIIHTSLEEFRPILEASNLQPEGDVPSLLAHEQQSSNKGIIIFIVTLIAVISFIAWAVDYNSRNSSIQYPTQQSTPSVSVSPTPTPRVIRRRRVQAPKIIQRATNASPPNIQADSPASINESQKEAQQKTPKL